MPNKTKKFLFLLIKLAIVIGAFYFIYNKVVYNEHIALNVFAMQLESTIFNNYATLFILVLFSCFNWFFEILKWKTLVSYCRTISFVAAAKQSLGSLTASLFTPNRIGEYGAKAIYFKKGLRKKIMLLNLVSNSTQMAVTVLFGSIGLLYFCIHFKVTIELFSPKKLAYLIAVFIVLIVLGRKFGSKKIRGFYIDKIIHFIKNIPSHIQIKNILFSNVRYLIFSHQFYFLVFIFGIDTDYQTAMALISSMYLLASLVPSLSLFDWLIKGSVAVWVFSFIQADELIIITITLVMWLLNFGIPAIFGSYYVLNFNFSTTLEPTKELPTS